MANAATAAAAAAARAPAIPAPHASQGAQSVTATIDYRSLATAMSRLNGDSASNLEKGTQSKWDFKHETFVDWQHKVEIRAESHDIRHLLEHLPVADPAQLRKHEIAKRIILLTLPNQDRAFVCGSLTLNEMWSKLLAKYMPSIDAEARKFWSKFSAFCQAGRPVVEHVNDCMTVKKQLIALGETVPEKQFVDKVLNIDRELSYLRPMRVRAPIDDIVAGLTDGYSYHYQDRQHQLQHQHGNAGKGRLQRRNPRRQGAPASAAVTGSPAMAGVNAVAGGGERLWYSCNHSGHLREDCDELHPEVREYLKQHAARGRGQGRGRGRRKGRGGPAVAVIVHTVTGGPAEARCESRRVAAARRDAARVRDDPTLNQAMACIHRERWLEAMLDELHSLSEHGAFELCELPAGYRPLPAKWVLKIKRGAQGEIDRFKARYVVKGFEQGYGFL